MSDSTARLGEFEGMHRSIVWLQVPILVGPATVEPCESRVHYYILCGALQRITQEELAEEIADR